MDVLFKQVEALFEVILLEDKLLLMREVVKEIESARSAARTLRNSKPGTPLPDADANLIKGNTSTTVGRLGNSDGYWLRLFNPKAVYSLHNYDAFYSFNYGNFDPPRDAGPSFVFDYRLTLPAYLEATTIRLIVFLRLVPDFRNLDGTKKELIEIANRLENVYTKIRGGIVSLATPTSSDITFHPASYTEDGSTSSPAGRSWGGWYGAVERYAAYGVVDTYQGNLDDGDYNHFLAKFTVGTLARWKRVYRNVGLDDLWKLVNFWKGLAGQPQSHEFDHSGDWSLREVDKIVAQALLNQPSTAGSNQMISLRNLVAMLGGSASSLRQSLEVT